MSTMGRVDGRGLADKSAFRLSADLLRQWRLVFGLPLVAGVGAVLLALVLPRSYSATSAFIPEARGARSGALSSLVGGVAGQLLSGMGGDVGETPRFYAQLLESRTILEEVLVSPYPEEDSTRTLLSSLRGIGGSSRADSLERGVRRLAKMVNVAVDVQSNIVTLTVTARSPQVAAALANSMIASINRFNAERRKTRARERRRFVEARLATTSVELSAAEDSVRVFLQGNRMYEQSPQLRFHLQGLQRKLDAASEVYVTLLRDFETARIEEVNDTPTLTVIDSAAVPLRKSQPRTLLLVFGSMVVAAAAGLVLAAVRAQVAQAESAGATDYADFRRTAASVRTEMVGLARAVLRREREAAP